MGIMYPNDPDKPFDAEAADAISKYYMLKEFGSAYTFDGLNQEQNRSMLLLGSCQKYHNLKVEFEQARHQFMSSNRDL